MTVSVFLITLGRLLHYAVTLTWSTSVRLLRPLKAKKPRIAINDSELFSIISTFDSNYSAFNDFQSRMDRYWSMRWIEQEGINELKATVVKATS